MVRAVVGKESVMDGNISVNPDSIKVGLVHEIRKIAVRMLIAISLDFGIARIQ